MLEIVTLFPVKVVPPVSIKVIPPLLAAAHFNPVAVDVSTVKTSPLTPELANLAGVSAAVADIKSPLASRIVNGSAKTK